MMRPRLIVGRGRAAGDNPEESAIKVRVSRAVAAATMAMLAQPCLRPGGISVVAIASGLHKSCATPGVVTGRRDAKQSFANGSKPFASCHSRSVKDGRAGLGRRIAIELLVVTAVGLALAALGPFGSYAVPLPGRALLWMSFILIGYLIMRPVVAVSLWLSDETGLARLPAQLLALTVASVPLSLLVDFILARLVPAAAASFEERYFQVWGIGLALILFMSRFLHRAEPSEPAVPGAASAPAVPAAARPRFLDRLPATIGSPLLCLSMEDHYVRAHGPAGSTLILMRMRDAVAELDGLPGLRVHRSWWVASDAVQRIEKEEGRVRLRLINGMTVPVARSYVGAVSAGGWPGAARLLP